MQEFNTWLNVKASLARAEYIFTNKEEEQLTRNAFELLKVENFPYVNILLIRTQNMI